MVVRYRVYRRMSSTLEHRAFVLVVASVFVLAGLGCALAALFISTPQIYLVEGLSRVQEVVLSWW